MTIIHITPTTTNDEILVQIQAAVETLKPFQLGRYLLSLRGSMWMVDDSLSSLTNIDGIAHGENSKAVAEGIFNGWMREFDNQIGTTYNEKHQEIRKMLRNVEELLLDHQYIEVGIDNVGNPADIAVLNQVGEYLTKTINFLVVSTHGIPK